MEWFLFDVIFGEGQDVVGEFQLGFLFPSVPGVGVVLGDLSCRIGYFFVDELLFVLLFLDPAMAILDMMHVLNTITYDVTICMSVWEPNTCWHFGQRIWVY